MVKMNFRPDEVEEFNFEPLPKGQYNAVVVETEEKATKSGDGSMLVLTWEIVSGDKKGRKLKEYLCLEHPNEQTVKIAQSALKVRCEAMGIPALNDSEQMHHKEVILVVDIAKAKPGSEYGDGNKITKVISIGGRTTGKTPPKGGAKTGNRAAAKEDGKAPWEGAAQ